MKKYLVPTKYTWNSTYMLIYSLNILVALFYMCINICLSKLLKLILVAARSNLRSADARMLGSQV